MSTAKAANKKCPVCKKVFKKKPLNRKVKEIMYSKLKFKCPCKAHKASSDLCATDHNDM